LNSQLFRNGKIVIRPDSGDPATVVTNVLRSLALHFGSTTNSKGYKVLSPLTRVIQGDGISYESLPGILTAVADAGFSAENLIFGSGGALLQKLNRDTQKCAFKCCYAEVAGVGRDVFKDPVTDPGKKSKKGRLTLECKGGQFVTVQQGLGDETKVRPE
jgi:nicotinamide phosphoribosyltransferase